VLVGSCGEADREITWERIAGGVSPTGNRRCESSSLQRTVCKLGEALFQAGAATKLGYAAAFLRFLEEIKELDDKHNRN
jgi:hypothetical protein